MVERLNGHSCYISAHFKQLTAFKFTDSHHQNSSRKMILYVYYCIIIVCGSFLYCAIRQPCMRILLLICHTTTYNKPCAGRSYFLTYYCNCCIRCCFPLDNQMISEVPHCRTLNYPVRPLSIMSIVRLILQRSCAAFRRKEVNRRML